MNGAMAEPSVRITNAPKISKKKIMGANQNFLRTFRNLQNSDIIASFDILFSSY